MANSENATSTIDDYKALTGTADRNELFGAEMRYGIELTPGIYPNPEDDSGLGGETIGEEYLRKIIDECQRNDIGVFLWYGQTIIAIST